MIPNPEISSDIPLPSGTTAERRTSGWDIRNAPRNYLSLVAYQAASALLSFGAVWIITRYLGSEGYGGIIAVIAASQVAQVFLNWTYVSVVRFGVDEFIETEKIARTFWIRLIFLALNFLLILVLAGLWYPVLASWLKLPQWAMLFVIGHIAATSIWLHVQMSLQAAKMPRVQGALLTVERALILGGLLVLVATARFDLMAAMTCYIVAPAVMTIVGVFALRNYVFARFPLDRAFFLKILAYSLPLFPTSLVGYFSGSYLDAIFVSRYLSTSDLGVYAVAIQISGIALQIPTLANSLLTPLIITLEKEEQSNRMIRYMKDVLPSIVLSWGLVCSVASFLAFFAISPIFGANFAEAAEPFWILLAGSCACLPVLLGYSAVSHAISATYISMWSAILAALGNVVFNFLLIPSFGLVGCAWATVLAYFLSSVAYAVLLRRKERVHISWTFVAMFPALLGSIFLSFGIGGPICLLICLAATFFIAYMRIDSIKVTLDFARGFGR